MEPLVPELPPPGVYDERIEVLLHTFVGRKLTKIYEADGGEDGDRIVLVFEGGICIGMAKEASLHIFER